MKMKIFISCFFLLLIFSCKKEVTEDFKPEFIGFWFSPPDGDGSGSSDYFFSINIKKNGDGVFTYHKNDCCSNEKIRAGKVRASDNILKIGWNNSFLIKTYPEKIDTAKSYHYTPIDPDNSISKKANWKMTLETSFFGPKCSGTFYKADY